MWANLSVFGFGETGDRIFWSKIYGHDLHQVPAELLHGRQVFGLMKDRDLNSKVLADLENDFTSEPKQSVLIGEDEFFGLTLPNQLFDHGKKLRGTRSLCRSLRMRAGQGVKCRKRLGDFCAPAAGRRRESHDSRLRTLRDI
jgi:hypothetical protein